MVTTLATKVRRLPSRLCLLAATLGLGCLGCTEPERFGYGYATAGQSCTQTSDCKPGLVCEKHGSVKRCERLYAPSTGPQRGDACQSDEQCDPPALICGRQNLCTPHAGTAEGGSCALSIECQVGLVCSSSGLCVPDEPCPPSGDEPCKTRDRGEACSPGQCRRPYVCHLDGQCGLAPLPLPAVCTRSDLEAGAFRFYFEVPRGEPDAEYEFYRLPFPNDIRVNHDGHVSLEGHAAPGDMLGADIRGDYFGTVEQDVRRFAINQPVFARSSYRIDLASVCLSEGSSYPPPPDDPDFEDYCAGGGAANVYLVNVTSGSEGYGERAPVEMASGTDAGLYICQNWIGVAPQPGRPLEPSTTYALVITTDVRGRSGATPVQEPELADLLAEQAPTDPILAEAHAKMEPLRTWMAAAGVSPSAIAVATVFTTGDHGSGAAKIWQAVQDAYAESTPPHFESTAVLCPAALPAGCDQELAGQPLFPCAAPSDSFFEIRGTYTFPIFQQGELPYETEDGGFVYDANGVPVLQGMGKMCYTLLIPKGAGQPQPAPGHSWPVVIYGHGTGGNFTSVTSTAEMLADTGRAAIGFDNVMHGRRQGSETAADWKDPGNLFFNVVNPVAARDNVLQGSADLFNLVRLLQEGGPTVAGPAGLFTVELDSEKIFYVGHSQGTVIAPPFVAFEPHVEAVVFSGAGAELPLSLLNKKKPVDGAEVLGAFFGDRSLSRVHPMMGVVSMLFAPTDAITYAELFVTSPPSGTQAGGRATGTSYLHVIGLDDNFTPDVTQNALLRATGVPLVGTIVESVEGAAGPVASPHTAGADGIIAGAVQLSPPPGEDGHFVVFDVPEATASVEGFLRTATDDSQPTTITR